MRIVEELMEIWLNEVCDNNTDGTANKNDSVMEVIKET